MRRTARAGDEGGDLCAQIRTRICTHARQTEGTESRPIAWVRFNPDDGTAPAGAAVQLRRCRAAVDAIRELIATPRDAVVYVNYA